ncbi:MAG: hypothetical protein HYX41_06535 [Bdellovibrio sp.]|nr:hypothetical protein [Bdellovibrio sp.]
MPVQVPDDKLSSANKPKVPRLSLSAVYTPEDTTPRALGKVTPRKPMAGPEVRGSEVPADLPRDPSGLIRVRPPVQSPRSLATVAPPSTPGQEGSLVKILKGQHGFTTYAQNSPNPFEAGTPYLVRVRVSKGEVQDWSCAKILEKKNKGFECLVDGKWQAVAKDDIILFKKNN